MKDIGASSRVEGRLARVASADHRIATRVVGSSVTARKRVAFVIAHLGAGGAQRVAVNAANALVSRGIDIHVITLSHRPQAYRLDSQVVLHTLSRSSTDLATRLGTDLKTQHSASSFNAASATVPGSPMSAFARALIRRGHAVGRPLYSVLHSGALLKRIWCLRQRLKAISADTTLAFLTQTNILTVLATRGLGTHTVISERNDPRLQRHQYPIELLRRLTYRFADVVTTNSQGTLSALESFVARKKLAYLPNPLTLNAIEESAQFTAPTVIAVGRLVEQKGFDVLLEAWAKVAPLLPGWRLAILGDGPLGGALQDLSRSLMIETRVDWLGHVSDPIPFLRGAKFYVLTSRFEGTPNALLEAMACGIPAVVSDASPGPRELIGRNGDAGLTVPVGDIEATARAILELAQRKTLRLRLGVAAKERAREYDVKKTIKVWLEILCPD